jgi:hypothetical protein
MPCNAMLRQLSCCACCRYAAAVEATMQQHEVQCAELRQQHASQLARVKARNDEILPQVGPCAAC